MCHFARVLLCLSCLALLSGCYTTKFYFADNDGSTGETHRELQHTFFWGFLSPGRVNLDRHCGSAGVKRVKSQVGGWGLLANWLTAGIWVPVTVKVTWAE